MKGDVYPVEPYEASINTVLDAHWGVLYEDDVSSLCHYLNFVPLEAYIQVM